MLSMTVVGDRELMRKLTDLSPQLKKATIKALRVSAKEIYNEAEENLRGRVLKTVNGNLRSTVDYRVDESRYEARIGQIRPSIGGKPVVYGPVHEFGATIIPKVAKALRFPVAGRGVRVNPETWKGPWAIVKRVTIPARPWLRPAYQAKKRLIEELFGREVEAVLEIKS